MLDSLYSCFRLIRTIHLGLYDAWIFGFFINDAPSTLVKPEYIATVKVADSIATKFIKNNSLSGLSLKLEERANTVASHCFEVPPYPFIKRKIRPRSRKKGIEKIDISIFDHKKSNLEVSRAIIEIKLTSSPYTLRADLYRNKYLMELSDVRSNNNLKIACLGFIVVDQESMEDKEASLFRASLKNKYMKLANEYTSIEYKTHVSVRKLCSPPNDEERIGEFVHMISIVISFIRC